MSAEPLAAQQDSAEASEVGMLDSLSTSDIYNEYDRTLLAHFFHIERQYRKYKSERDFLSCKIRMKLNHEGVVRFHIPGVGKVTLMPGREFKGCEHGVEPKQLDPYLKIEPED